MRIHKIAITNPSWVEEKKIVTKSNLIWVFAPLKPISFWDLLNQDFHLTLKYVLQKIAYKILRSRLHKKWKNEYTYKPTEQSYPMLENMGSYTPLEISVDKIIDLAYEHIREVYRYQGYRPTHLLLGRDEYSKVIHTAYAEKIKFSTGFYLNSDHDYDYDNSSLENYLFGILGIRIVLVPYMQGMIAVNLAEDS